MEETNLDEPNDEEYEDTSGDEHKGPAEDEERCDHEQARLATPDVDDQASG